MNNLKEQLRFRMLGQLSDERTKEDIDNAYDVAVDFTLSFLTFLRENYVLVDTPNDSYWQTVYGEDISEKELLNKFLEEYGT
jgi:hypothetical protein